MIILIADDHPSSVFVTSQLAQTAFGDQHQVESVGDTDALLGRLGGNGDAVGLLVLDLTMPGELKRLPLIREVRRLTPELPVVVHSADDAPMFVEAALELGICGFVSKAASFSCLRTAMELAIAGQTYVDPSIDLAAAANHPWKTLTPSEREVMLALAKGQTLRSLANESGRGYTTITNHKYAAMEKLNLVNSEISGWLVGAGLLFLLDS